MPTSSSQHQWLASLALLLCTSMAPAQEHLDTLEISAGANLSAVSQIDGILMDPRWSPALDLLYRHENLFIDSENGIGIALFRDKPVHIGAMVDYQYGRRTDADSRYRGMGNVSGSIAPAAFIEWEPIRDALDIYANASKAIAGTTGWLYKLELSGGFPLTAAINLYFDITGNASDKNYAQAYYGVNTTQSSASSYRVFSPRGGWSTLNTALGFEYRYSKELALNAQIGQLRYLDSAKTSPLVDAQTSFTTGIFATYRY
jgi:outer membrane protein